MPNMSYCRFENTLEDLRDCLNVLRGYEDDISSKSEANYAKSMLTSMVEFLERQYVIPRLDGYDYEGEIDRIVENCMKLEDEYEE